MLELKTVRDSCWITIFTSYASYTWKSPLFVTDVLRAIALCDAPVSGYSTLLTGLAKNELTRKNAEDLMKENVMDIAKKEVVSVTSTTSLEEIASLFGFRQLKKIPVIDNGKLVGVVNRSRFNRRVLENTRLKAT